MDYFALKHMHMGFAGLSGGLFLLRGLLMLAGSRLREQRWAKILPHVIDTLLLVTAIVLAVWSAQYPLQQGWLTAKVVALFVYIGLGTVALKRRSGPAFFAALLTFGYIVAVAVTKNPLVVF
ncbi:MAG TPA: SirB2 family protein [Noviherbaspirillum sp.]